MCTQFYSQIVQYLLRLTSDSSQRLRQSTTASIQRLQKNCKFLLFLRTFKFLCYFDGHNAYLSTVMRSNGSRLPFKVRMVVGSVFYPGDWCIHLMKHHDCVNKFIFPKVDKSPQFVQKFCSHTDFSHPPNNSVQSCKKVERAWSIKCQENYH